MIRYQDKIRLTQKEYDELRKKADINAVDIPEKIETTEDYLEAKFLGMDPAVLEAICAPYVDEKEVK